MHGITLSKRPEDWEILQQKDGFASVILEGSYQVHPAAIEVGVEAVCPVVRVMREDDNTCVLPWQPMEHHTNADFGGTFCHTFPVPAGGLYRVETSLETKSTVPDLTWLYRGDCVLHLGVGYVFILAGQSNASGYSRDYAFDPPDIHVHLFRNRGSWDMACDPMNESTDAGSLANEEMGIPGVSPYLSFSKNLYRFTGLPVGLVQTTLGGAPMERWLPGTGDLYQNMIEKIEQTHGSYAGVLWYQGCSDCNQECAPHYLSRFTEMVTGLRGYLGYDIPFFTFQLNREIGSSCDTSWGMVREAQRLAAHTLKDVYILPTMDCGVSDNIHNNAHANMMLGEKMFRLCAHVLSGAPAFFAPELAALRLLEGNQLELEFSNMALGFVLFAVKPENSGFLIEDAKGNVGITALRANRQDKNHMYLTLDRKPEADAVISFAWEANPVAFPMLDEVTFLPPLAFYKMPVYGA